MQFGCYNDDVEQFLSSIDHGICQQMQELSLNNTQTSTKNMQEKKDKSKQRSSLKLVNILMRFRNLSILHLLIIGAGKWKTKHLFENCTKLIELAICDSTIKMFHQVKKNCLQINFIRVVESQENQTTWKAIHKLFPRASFEVFSIIDGKILPVKSDWIKNNSSPHNFNH